MDYQAAWLELKEEIEREREFFGSQDNVEAARKGYVLQHVLDRMQGIEHQGRPPKSIDELKKKFLG
jgi:hypothetical protein